MKYTKEQYAACARKYGIRAGPHSAQASKTVAIGHELRPDIFESANGHDPNGAGYVLDTVEVSGETPPQERSIAKIAAQLPDLLIERDELRAALEKMCRAVESQELVNRHARAGDYVPPSMQRAYEAARAAISGTSPSRVEELERLLAEHVRFFDSVRPSGRVLASDPDIDASRAALKGGAA